MYAKTDIPVMTFSRPPIKYILEFKIAKNCCPETEVYWATCDLTALNLVKKTLQRRGAKEGIVVSLYNTKTKTYLIDRRVNILKEGLDITDKRIQEMRDSLIDSMRLPRSLFNLPKDWQ